MINFITDAKVTRLANAGALSTGITSTALDTAGFLGNAFLIALGTLSATATVKVQQSSDNGSADAYADLKGTTLTASATDDNKLVLVEVDCPNERYLKVNVTGGAEDTIDGIFAVQFMGREYPVTQPAGVVAKAITVAPSEA